MENIENIERIRMVIEAAKHMNMHTPPMVRGSIVCVSHLVCPTWVSNGWLQWPIFSSSLGDLSGQSVVVWSWILNPTIGAMSRQDLRWTSDEEKDMCLESIFIASNSLQS